MTTQRMHEKYAWIVFVIIGLMGLVLALPVWFDPSAGADVFEQLDGVTVPATIADSAEATAYVEFLYRFAFTATVGVDLLTVVVAVFAFRHAARWAWLAFCYWPALFLTNFLTYQESARYIQIVMLTLTVGALAASYRKVWLQAPHRQKQVAQT